MPRIEAALGQLFGEYPPVGCVTHRIYGGSTGNDVIGLVQGPPAPGLAEIVGDHNLGAVLADDPADHSAQGHAVLQNPVRQPQKLHDVDTDEFRRLDLLCLTHSAALIWGQAIDARLTAGDHRVTDGFARVGPPGHGRRRAELKIIRMRHDAQGGAPRLVDGCKIRHSVRLIRRTIGVPEVASGSHPVPEIALQPTQIGKASIDVAIPHHVIVDGHSEDATHARAKRHLRYVCGEGRQQLRSQPSGAQQPSTLRAIGDHDSGRVRRTHALKPDTGLDRSPTLMAMDGPPIAVVGGGLAGMAAAARLAKVGHTVDLYERAGVLGGSWAPYELTDGVLVDDAPAVLGFPAPWRDLFRKSGRPLEAELARSGRALVPAELPRLIFADGATLVLSSNRGEQHATLLRAYGASVASRWRDLLD